MNGQIVLQSVLMFQSVKRLGVSTESVVGENVSRNLCTTIPMSTALS